MGSSYMGSPWVQATYVYMVVNTYIDLNRQNRYFKILI
jgi:hypothetical protein